MTMPAMPSIALPTGPYDWHADELPRTVFEARVEGLRRVMVGSAVTHAVVHGNILDHGALAWLTHFTPKLGPAYALVPAGGSLRILCSGGPGMRPSAQRLTWVEDVVALRGVEGDVKRWIGEMTAAGDTPARLGLVEGSSMLRGDWRAVQRAGGGAAVELDPPLDAMRAERSAHEVAASTRADEIARLALDELAELARPGADLRTAAIEMERAAYRAGAQDIRVRISRRSGGPPTTLPDAPLPMAGPTEVVLAVRHKGQWAHRRRVLT